MLDPATCPLVLLKGAAYIAQGLAIAEGRLPSDLDILIPREHLAEARARLADAGWHETLLDDHDRLYYEQWSHELPPMRHPDHGVELDVHHAILPPRDGQMVDTRTIVDRCIPSARPGWRVLGPVDQLLHSAAHLFYDSEPRDRVRDLVDLDGLFRHFGTWPGFWEELPARAAELDLAEPLVLACHFTRRWLGTPLPHALADAAQTGGAGRRPARWRVAALSAVLRPTEPDATDGAVKQLAATALLAQYHWHRMPLRVLLPHLWRKISASRP